MEPIKDRILDASMEFEVLNAPLLVSITDKQQMMVSLMAFLRLDDDWQQMTRPESTATVDDLRNEIERAFYTLYERQKIKIDPEVGLSRNGVALLGLLQMTFGKGTTVAPSSTVAPKTLTLEEEVIADYYGTATRPPLSGADQKAKYLSNTAYREAFKKAEKDGLLDRLSTHKGAI